MWQQLLTLMKSSTPVPSEGNASAFSSLLALRRLRPAAQALLAQLQLLGQLAQVEWAEERQRLTGMLLAALLGAIFMLCTMLLIGALVLMLSWDTVYRIPSVLVMLTACAIAMGVMWRRVRVLSSDSEFSFAATRAELALDIELIKSRL
jgi:uncharacterized membrane protein YqjE